MIRDCWIFDIDNTIANNNHRLPWIRSKPKNWKAYNATLLEDKPILPAIRVLKSLYIHEAIVLCSGRDSGNRSATETWLINLNIPYSDLYMRPEGDYRADDIIKEELLAQIRLKYNPLGVFDDRRKVCEMWVRNGLHLFDVSQLKDPF